MIFSSSGVSASMMSCSSIVQCPVVDDDPFDDKSGTQSEGPCYDTPVHDADDWNGYRVKPNPIAKLASTGAGVAVLVVCASAMLAGGVLLVVMARRRAGTARHVSSER